MNQSSHNLPHARQSPQGRTFAPQSEAELAEAIDKAFDYRGDVTLSLDDGTALEGYMANRDAKTCIVEFFPRNLDVIQLPYARIKAITFTGHDTADGKSWEAWMTKKAEERSAEAERLRQEAIARGEL